MHIEAAVFVLTPSSLNNDISEAGTASECNSVILSVYTGSICADNTVAVSASDYY